MWQQWLEQLQRGNVKSLARSISFIENEQPGYQDLLLSLPVQSSSKIIGITGPPGAGKSTLVDGLIREIITQSKRVAILCVDPSSPFNLGAVLGDRIRMSDWYTHPDVFIRSLATRGSMGGLHPKIIEITDLVRAALFDYIIVETVGVGQSEIEIAGLADTTVVVVVPEAGDEVQTMKAGLMEIADIFVVNKSDRPDADTFVRNLRLMLAPAFASHQQEIPVIKTVAQQHSGLDQLLQAIQTHQMDGGLNQKKAWLLTEKAFQLIQKERMKDIDKRTLKEEIEKSLVSKEFHLYSYIRQWL
jgi:LAO/AO transport system kinase